MFVFLFFFFFSSRRRHTRCYRDWSSECALPISSEALKTRAQAALREFAAHGTTTVEAKSGYGLDIASELKILRLHKELAAEQPLEIVSTFLGAHVVPPEFRGKPNGGEKYIALLIDKLMQEAANQKLGDLCDVFCDRRE